MTSLYFRGLALDFLNQAAAFLDEMRNHSFWWRNPCSAKTPSAQILGAF
jgi:hypothetical protein